MAPRLISFGALTLSGHGGVPAPKGAKRIVGGTASGYTLSDNLVAFESDRSGKAGVLIFDVGDEWQISIEADTYDITGNSHANATQLSEIVADAGDKLGGKTIRARAGALLGALSIYRIAIDGTLTIKSEDRSNRAVAMTVLFADLSPRANIHWIDVDLDSRSEDTSGPDPTFAAFEYYGTGGTLHVTGMNYIGLMDPYGNDWDEFDMMAKILVAHVKGGTLNVGNYLRGPNSRNQIAKITDNLDGTFWVWLRDNYSGFQGTAHLIRTNDVFDVYKGVRNSTAKRVTCIAATDQKCDAGFVQRAGNKNPNRDIFLNSGRWRHTIIENSHFRNCGRLWGGNTSLEMLNNTVDTWFGDVINPGFDQNPAAPPALTIRGNTWSGAWMRGDFLGNPHGDILQLSQKAPSDWKDIVIENNFHFFGDGVCDSMSFFLELEYPGVYVHAKIRNNFVEGGITCSRAKNCEIVNNTLGRNWDPTSGIAYSALLIAPNETGTDGGGNIMRRNVAGNIQNGRRVLSEDNVQLRAGMYDTAFSEDEPWVAATLTKELTLVRYTPRNRGSLMVGRHDGAWRPAKDVGCIDSAGRHVAYQD